MQNDEPRELELRDYVRVLRRRKAIIILSVIVVVGAALVVSYLQTPVYSAGADVLLQADASSAVVDGSSTGTQTDPSKSVSTQIEIIKSRPVHDAVVAKIGPVHGVSAAGVGQTAVIRIKAQSTVPKRAADIANAYAQSYIDVRQKQTVDELLAAAQQIQGKVTDLQKQIDGLSAQLAAATDPVTQARV